MWPTATWLFTHTNTVKQRFRLVLCIFEISSKYCIYCCNHSTTEQNRNLIRTSAIEEFEFPNPNILESFNQLRIGSKDCPRSKQLLEMEEKSNLTMIWNSEQYVRNDNIPHNFEQTLYIKNSLTKGRIFPILHCLSLRLLWVNSRVLQTYNIHF